MYQSPITFESNQLMTKLAPLLVDSVRQSVVMMGAEQGGNTAKSIRQRTLASTAGRLHRQIIGDEGLRAMVRGRKAGGKMPVRQVGTGKRGGKVFEPLPQMLKWFNGLNIPKSSWFPIMRSLVATGTPPKRVIERAIQMAKPAMRAQVRLTAMQMGRGVIQKRGT
jgi:hypothetical protein